MIFTTKVVQDIRNQFKTLLLNEQFVIDKSGVKTIELVNASFIANEDSIFGTPNEDWHKRELEWYLSQSLNVNDIPPPIPKIWKQIADPDGFINSNYGWAVFSDENGNQYDNCKKALLNNPSTRQAIMIYNRPTMHYDFNKNGRSDFMCLQNTQHFIRDNKLYTIANFRSNDGIFGYKGDYSWVSYIHSKLCLELILSRCNDLHKIGDLIWNAMSLHVYESHFHLVK